MLIRDGHQRTAKDGLKARELNDLFDSARRTSQIRGGQGLMASSLEGGIHVMSQTLPDHAGWGARTVGEGFIAKIVDHGPDGQDDYEDARYWVQELFETSPPGTTIHDRMVLDNEVVIASEYPVRYFTATNLAEYVGEEGGSHGLATDGSVVVDVSMAISESDGAAKFHFTHGGQATGTIEPFRIMFVREDWVYATRLRTGEDDVKVAKPYSLRRTPWSGTTVRIVYLNILVTYAYDPMLITSDKRTATIQATGEEFTEIVIPQYRPGTGEIMLAAHVGLDPMISPEWDVQWADLNVAGRAWAVMPQEEG